MIQWVKRHHRKIQEIGMGLFIWETINFLFDWIFYPFALAYWGIVLGGAILVAIALTVNGIVFWLYDYMRVDWLGANALRELDEKESKSNLEKLVTWIGKKKVTLWEKLLSPIVFVTLTLPIDPLIVAIHYRKEHFKGLTLRDWGIFLAAGLAANAWWLLKVGLVVELVKFVLHHWHLFGW